MLFTNIEAVGAENLPCLRYPAGVDNKGNLPRASGFEDHWPHYCNHWPRSTSGIDPNNHEKEQFALITFIFRGRFTKVQQKGAKTWIKSANTLIPKVHYSSKVSSSSISSSVGWFMRPPPDAQAVYPGRLLLGPDCHHLKTALSALKLSTFGPSMVRYMRRLRLCVESFDRQSLFTLFIQEKPLSHTAVLIAMVR